MKKKGFTLVELLATIIILAVIIIIAVPKINDAIDVARRGSFLASASTILHTAQQRNEEYKIFENTNPIVCEDLVSLSEINYETCELELINDIEYITLVGQGKFEGMSICNKNMDNIEITEGCEKLLTFDPNGGTVNPTSKSIPAGSEYGELPIPTKSEYSFVGWFTELESGVRESKSTIATDSNAKTLYAHWEKQPFLQIKLMGGTGNDQEGYYEINTPNIINSTYSTRI